MYKLNKGDNFNDLLQLKAFRFKHNAKIANEISAKLNGGEVLFPHDALKIHWRDDARKRKVVSRDAVYINLMRNPDETFESIKQKLETDYGIIVGDYKPVLSAEELHGYYQAIENEGYWEEFCNQIYIPGDDVGKMMKDLLNLPNNPEYEWAFKENKPYEIDYKKGFLLREYEHILNA